MNKKDYPSSSKNYTNRYRNKETEDFLKTLSEIRERVREDKAFGKQLLTDAGIIDSKGDFTEPYKHLCTLEEQG